MFELAPLPRNLEATLRDVHAKRVDVRKSVLRDLARHLDGPSRAAVAESLRHLLREDPDVEVRVLSAIAAADGGATELLPELLEALRDPSPRVTQFALLAIGELAPGFDAVRSGVEPYLTSTLPALRYQAIATACQLDCEQSTELLLSAVEDPDPEVQWLGWHWLARFRDGVASSRFPAASRAPEAKRWVVASAAVGHLLSDADRGEALFDAARRAPARVLAEASLTLLRLNPERAFAMVLPLLSGAKGPDEAQLLRIIEELGVGGCRPSLPWLTCHARRGWLEGKYGWPSLVALARLGDRGARDAIEAEAAHRNPRRSERARAVLGELLPQQSAFPGEGRVAPGSRPL